MFISVDEDRVRGWPAMPLFQIYVEDVFTPLWVPPGIWYQPEGFVSFLARLASVDKGDGLHLAAHSMSEGVYTDVPLTRHMDARQIAALTGFDVAMVRDTLANHLTIIPEPAEPSP